MTMTAARRWSMLAVVASALLLITLDNSILYTTLPTLTTQLGAGTTESLWIINAYPLVMAGLLLGAGTLGDRVGHRRMFLIGLLVFGAASLLAAFSPTPTVLIAARALLAVGAAAMMPATLALIRLAFHNERERNFAIAVWGTLAIVGAALGPILSGLLLEAFWWGSVFLINVPVVVVAFVAGLILTPRGEPDPSKKWDAISSMQVMVGLVGLVVAIKEFGHLPPSPIVLAVSLIAAVLGFTLFARRQRRLPYPLLDFGIFRNPAFLSGVLSAALAMFTIAGVELLTTQRFQLVGGLSPLEAGILVAVVAVGSLPTSLLGGAFLHRVGLLPLIAGGLAVGAVGAVLVAVTFRDGGGWLIGSLLLLGAGLGATMSVASTAIVGNAPEHRAGMASSIEEVSYEFGSLSAVAVLGSMVAAVYSATVSLPPGSPDEARESLGAAIEVAPAHGGAGIVDAAASAYDGAYLIAMIVIASVLVLGAVATGILLRRRGPRSAAATGPAH